MEVMIDFSAFRRSVSQLGTILLELKDAATLADALRELAAKERGLAEYLVGGVERGEVRFAVNGTVVSDLQFKLRDKDAVIVLPVLDGG